MRSLSKLFRAFTVLIGAGTLTAALFFVLPLIQAITKPPKPDLILRKAEVVDNEPPEPEVEEPPEQEPEEEEPPPELEQNDQPLDLSQLKLSLNPSTGGDWMSGNFALKLNTLGGFGNRRAGLFSLRDLDQGPQPISQRQPDMTPETRAKGWGQVYIIFIVDENGRVLNPKIQRSTDPVFEGPALAAVAKWKFEPGRRGGQAVRTRMRVPVTFPKVR